VDADDDLGGREVAALAASDRGVAELVEVGTGLLVAGVLDRPQGVGELEHLRQRYVSGEAVADRAQRLLVGGVVGQRRAATGGRLLGRLVSVADHYPVPERGDRESLAPDLPRVHDPESVPYLGVGHAGLAGRGGEAADRRDQV